jgi:hypothetical protein
MSMTAYPLELWKKKAATVAASDFANARYLLRSALNFKTHKYVTAIL